MIDVGARLDRQRSLVWVHEREDPFPQLTLDALLDQFTIRMHDLTLLRPVDVSLGCRRFS